MSKNRFLPTGLPIIPSESILSISCSFFSGKGLFTSSTGGRALIFLPCIPVFLCHKPDLGCIPHHRFRFGDPTTPSFNGCIDTFPTTHWQRSSISIYFWINFKILRDTEHFINFNVGQEKIVILMNKESYLKSIDTSLPLFE